MSVIRELVLWRMPDHSANADRIRLAHGTAELFLRSPVVARINNLERTI
jgi:hypothetical protein